MGADAARTVSSSYECTTQAWKDHLLEMDHLKTAIMQRPAWAVIRPIRKASSPSRDAICSHRCGRESQTRVTDIDLQGESFGDGSRARQDPAGGSAPRLCAAVMRTQPVRASQAPRVATREAALRAQGVPSAKVETIRREEPKVGRNQPCPCGSGKKYKQCHGKQ